MEYDGCHILGDAYSWHGDVPRSGVARLISFFCILLFFAYTGARFYDYLKVAYWMPLDILINNHKSKLITFFLEI